MRLVFVLNISLALVLGGLTGCSRPKPPPLRILVSLAPEQRSRLDAQIAEFSRLNDQMEIEVWEMNSLDECRSRFESSLREGVPPDICLIDSKDLGWWMQDGKLDDLRANRLAEKEIAPEVLKSFAIGNRLYAAPCGWSVMVLYYNREIFGRHGLPPPTRVWDWGDFLNAAQAMTVTHEDEPGSVRYGVEIRAAAEMWLPFLWQNRGEIIGQDGSWLLTDPRYVQSNIEAIEFYAALVREHGVAPAPSAGIPRETTELFLKRQAAMTFGHREFGCRLQKQGMYDWEIAPLPQGRDSATLLEAQGYAISARGKRKADAWKLIAYLTRETAEAAMIQTGAAVPSRPALWESKIFLDFPGPRAVRNRVFPDSLTFSRLPPRTSDWLKAAAVLTDEMSVLMRDKQDNARAALERMQARLDEMRLLRNKPKMRQTPPDIREKAR